MIANLEKMNASPSRTPEYAACESEWLPLPKEYCEARWYAAYTSANHEKRVAEQMGKRGVEHFLPLYACSRRWKDRWVMLQRPLFPGYVFVQIALRDRLRVQKIPGVACLVGFDGTPAALPDEEIEALRTSLGTGVRAEPYPYLRAGCRVRIRVGPLTGLDGFLVRRKGNLRVILSINLLQRSIAVDADLADLEAIHINNRPSTAFDGTSRERSVL